MVDLTLRALFESSSKILSTAWHSTQRGIEQNRLPEDDHEHYVRGCFLVWQNLLKRTCDGCLAKDSESIFFLWLEDYKKHLTEAVLSDGEGNSYLRGQVDAFSVFVKTYATLAKGSSQLYKKKLKELEEKQKEIELLEAEMENIMWSFSKPAQDSEGESHEMSSVP